MGLAQCNSQGEYCGPHSASVFLILLIPLKTQCPPPPHPPPPPPNQSLPTLKPSTTGRARTYKVSPRVLSSPLSSCSSSAHYLLELLTTCSLLTMLRPELLLLALGVVVLGVSASPAAYSRHKATTAKQEPRALQDFLYTPPAARPGMKGRGELLR